MAFDELFASLKRSKLRDVSDIEMPMFPSKRSEGDRNYTRCQETLKLAGRVLVKKRNVCQVIYKSGELRGVWNVLLAHR